MSANVVKLRCACGQRLRLRNAQPGQAVACPKCGKGLVMPGADAGDDGLQLQALSTAGGGAAREAVLIDRAPLRIAASGGRVGLTGRLAHTHDEALLMTARTGRPIDVQTLGSSQPRPGARGGDEFVVSTPGRGMGSFIDDVLATYYFAGSRMNLAHVLVTALAAMILALLGSVFPAGFWVLTLFNYAVYGIAAVIALQFFWSVLSVTAGGDDELPLVAPNWDPWDDAVRPTILLGLITLGCSVPVIYVARYLPAGTPGYGVWLAGAALLGTFFWPMAMLATAISGSIFAARPDLVVRSILRIGPAYLVAWVAALLTVGSWGMTYAYSDRLIGIPVAGAALTALLQVGLTFYYGYALFRILGLVYRHYEGRMAWK